MTKDSLRNKIGTVTAETSMSNCSVEDKIRYGRPDASDEDVLPAIEKAEADEFIAISSKIMGIQGMMRILVSGA